MKNLFYFLLPLIFFNLVACSFNNKKPQPQPYARHVDKSNVGFIYHRQQIQSSSQQQNNGQIVLSTAQKMVAKGEIIRGGCWDYLNVAYNRAGFDYQNRQTVFKSHKKRGPFAKQSIIKPGDWLYFINHSYHNSEHSGMFVSWVDYNKKIANLLSYPGGNRKKPGRYRNYNLKSVWNVMRPKD
ncbi:MAG: hypothetical protein DRQ51_02490 [Gammaproteobacteria bacterium]|nr:MAG: hypothetical protein DRQ51_02490 [Gammaproteobacteria bacterium]